MRNSNFMVLSLKTTPIVAIPCCVREVAHMPFHMAGDKYVHAVAEGAQALPITLPAIGGRYPLTELVERLDGILLTGSPSNIEPRHYAGEDSRPGTPHDPARDATNLPLIKAAIAAGVPIFGICRGFQELNVALGGSLHQYVHEVPGKMDHRENKTLPAAEQYGLAHPVMVQAGGLLEQILGKSGEIMVNSLHGQGINQLAAGLQVEAVAPDGLIEAVSLPSAKALTMAVQWHPEWRFWENPHSLAILQAFGAAVAARAESRR